jgi:hypothetical protein
VRGFVWKSHEEHTVDRCRALGAGAVRAIASASLNPWAALEDTWEAIEAGAVWVWGPTANASGTIGWDLPLPAWWPPLADRLEAMERPLVLATGHLGREGRDAFAALAARSVHLCSITHGLYVPIEELLALAARGCAIEIDAYSYAFPVQGRSPGDPASYAGRLLGAGGIVYLTSDGGQAATGDPFAFGARVLDELEGLLGSSVARCLGVENPAAIVARVDSESAAT